MRKASFPLLAGAAGVLSLVGWAVPQPAHACGGFFCSQAAPVNQQAEEIIFVDNGDGSVTAVIRIQYVGPADRFAWVLPLPGVPDIGVSSNVAFDRLRQQTDPQYFLDYQVEGTCRQPGPNDGFFGNVGMQTPGSGASPPSLDSGVSVLAEGSVGPYDHVTIGLDPALADPADAAVDWLLENGYDVTDIGPDVLRPYLEDGLNLTAFRLTKGSMSGAIRPVEITYDSELPMIPIRPTAVAAEDDMGVSGWCAVEVPARPGPRTPVRHLRGPPPHSRDPYRATARCSCPRRPGWAKCRGRGGSKSGHSCTLAIVGIDAGRRPDYAYPCPATSQTHECAARPKPTTPDPIAGTGRYRA
jgi:hypothetical protein